MKTMESRQPVQLRGSERPDGTIVLKAQSPPGCLDALARRGQAVLWEMVKAALWLFLGWVLAWFVG